MWRWDWWRPKYEQDFSGGELAGLHVMNTVLMPALRLLGVLTLMTGVAYPLIVTLAARAVFPGQSEGSLVRRSGAVVGSALLAQSFTNDACFWPRPSAADYRTVPSGASNQGPTAGDLRTVVMQRASEFRKAHGLGPQTRVPPEMVFASGSGLDPHISPEAARLQIERVARARHLSPRQTQRLAAWVERCVERPQLGFLGEPRVNILLLNLGLGTLE